MDAIESREERPADSSIQSGYVYPSALHMYRASTFNLLYVLLVSRTALPCQSISVYVVSRYLCPSGYAHLDLSSSFSTSDLLRGGEGNLLTALSSELLSENPRETSVPRENVSHRSATSCSYYRETTS